jgi:F-type H+-transporting ATPase subunit delta
MPTDKAQAAHYADALVSLGHAVDALPQFEEDLADVLDFLETNADTRRFLRDHAVEIAGKCRAIEELLTGRAHPALVQFLVLLLRERRLESLRDIAEAFFRKVSALRREAAGELVSPTPLDDETVARIEKETGLALGKEVHLRVRVDANLLGGLFVKVGDFVLDGTVDRRLDDIRHQLLA